MRSHLVYVHAVARTARLQAYTDHVISDQDTVGRKPNLRSPGVTTLTSRANTPQSTGVGNARKAATKGATAALTSRPAAFKAVLSSQKPVSLPANKADRAMKAISHRRKPILLPANKDERPMKGEVRPL